MKNKQLLRTKSIIDNDRLGLVYGAEEIIRRDIEDLLKEYFSLSAPVDIKLTKNGQVINIQIFSQCTGVKRVTLLKS